MTSARGLVRPLEFQAHPIPFLQAQHTGQWRGIVKQVHDGDTLVVFTDKGFFDYQMLKLRLRAVSAPELHEPGGLAARDFLATWLLGEPVIFAAEFGRTGNERMTFDRYVADIYRCQPLADGPQFIDVAQELIAQGHATRAA